MPDYDTAAPTEDEDFRPTFFSTTSWYIENDRLVGALSPIRPGQMTGVRPRPLNTANAAVVYTAQALIRLLLERIAHFASQIAHPV